jgi:hypothetical protein
MMLSQTQHRLQQCVHAVPQHSLQQKAMYKTARTMLLHPVHRAISYMVQPDCDT